MRLKPRRAQKGATQERGSFLWALTTCLGCFSLAVFEEVIRSQAPSLIPSCMVISNKKP